jgi:hypothetical protein
MTPELNSASGALSKPRDPRRSSRIASLLRAFAVVALILALCSWGERLLLWKSQAQMPRTSALVKQLSAGSLSGEERLKELRETREREAGQLQELQERHAKLEPIVRQTEELKSKKAALVAELRILAETDGEARAILARNDASVPPAGK